VKFIEESIDFYGLKIIKNTAIEIEPNSFNKKYLETKRDKMGHEILKHKH